MASQLVVRQEVMSLTRTVEPKEFTVREGGVRYVPIHDFPWAPMACLVNARKFSAKLLVATGEMVNNGKRDAIFCFRAPLRLKPGETKVFTAEVGGEKHIARVTRHESQD